MKGKISKSSQSGQSLIEILIAMAIFSLITSSSVFLVLDAFISARQGGERTRATAMASEGIEATKSIHNRGWKYLTDGDHGIQINTDNPSNPYWEFNGSQNSIDQFTRIINVSSVNRDVTGDIIESGGTSDIDTKKITCSVTWEFTPNRTNNVVLSSYSTNYNGRNWKQSTKTDFDGGIKTDVQTTQVDDGEVQLSGGSGGIDWSNPQISGSYDALGDVNANDVFVSGDTAYLIRSSSGDDKLCIIDVTNKASPLLLGSLNLDSQANGIYVSGNYAYIASTLNGQELQIVDISNPGSLNIDGSFDALGRADANDVFVTGDTAYLVRSSSRDDELCIIDVTNKASPSLLGSLNLGAQANGIYVSGNYAYIASTSNNQELQIVDISNPGSLNIDGSFDALGRADANDVFVLINTAYLVRNNGKTAEHDFHILDVSNPGSIINIGSLDLNTNSNDIYISGNYAFLATEDISAEFKVIDISTPASPSVFGTADLNDDAYGIFVDEDYAFVADISNSAELYIISGAASGFATSGNLESSDFDTGSSSTLYNYIIWTAQVPPGTTLKFQIRTADTQVGLFGATWVGLDGTNSTYYETSGEVITTDPGASGTNWIQYKAYFEGDGITTSILEDITINYEI